MSTIKFIAPNGAKVTVKEWERKATSPDPEYKWHDELLLTIIFNDPLLGEAK